MRERVGRDHGSGPLGQAEMTLHELTDFARTGPESVRSLALCWRKSKCLKL